MAYLPTSYSKCKLFMCQCIAEWKAYAGSSDSGRVDVP